MGKLKTSLTGLAAIAEGIKQRGEKAVFEMQGRATTVQKCIEQVNGGYELLYMYLKQKAIKGKVQITAWHKDTLKAHTDSQVAGFIANIEKVRADSIKAF